MISTRIIQTFSILMMACLLTGCLQKNEKTFVEALDPYRYAGMNAVKEGNLQLIVSQIDQQIPNARVLVEIQRRKPGESTTTEPKRIFYNTLPEADANILVLSHYNFEPGPYRVTFWEQNTGLQTTEDVYLSKEKQYLVAFYGYEEDRDGEFWPDFQIRNSNTPIVTNLTPRQIGKVQ